MSINDTLSIGIMTKYWDAGRVKTRLGASLGMVRAAALHRLFVTYLCESLGCVKGNLIACVAPDSSTDDFSAELALHRNGRNWVMMPQGGGTLGERMQRWFVHCLKRDSSKAILIGADCPTLSPQVIDQAKESLDRHDLVLGPAVDGGYYLIGLRGSWVKYGTSFEPLFQGIQWSTDSVFSDTLERASSKDLSVARLETMEDVDTQVELDRLREQLENDRRHSKLRESIDALLADPSLSTDINPT